MISVLRASPDSALMNPIRRDVSSTDRPSIEAASRWPWRSEEHTSELQSLMRISYAVFCLKKKKYINIFSSFLSFTHTITSTLFNAQITTILLHATLYHYFNFLTFSI